MQMAAETRSGMRCGACRDGVDAPFQFTMAFQPILDVTRGEIYAYEALVRGPEGESASTVLGQVTRENLYSFDQNCRVKAISLGAALGLPRTGAYLAINFMPGAVYSAEACIRLTLETASLVGFPCEQLIFEVSEAEEVKNRPHLQQIVAEYRRLGFKVALDDFGASHAGLNLLAAFPSDIIKLDMELTRNLPERPAARAIMKAMVGLARELGNELIAEGVETVDEFRALEDCGVRLMQGYLFAQPGFERLPEIAIPR